MKYDLNRIEREKPKEPFTLDAEDGTEVVFADPKKLHWSVLADLDENAPFQMIPKVVTKGLDALRTDSRMDVEALGQVLAAWREHYGTGTPGEA